MTKPIRLVVSDVDGTLVDPDKKLRAATIAAVKRLEAAGVGFTIISAPGRVRGWAGWPMSCPSTHRSGRSTVGPCSAGWLGRRAVSRTGRGGERRAGDGGGQAVAIWVFADDRWYASSGEGTHVDHERKASAQEPVVTQDFAALVGKVDKITLVSDDADLLRGLHDNGECGTWGRGDDRPVTDLLSRRDRAQGQ